MSRPLPQPHEVRAAVTTKLLESSALLSLLAPNPPWNDPDGEPSPANSIVPMDEIDKMTPPYVGIMAGPMTRNAYASFNGFMYIRVYAAMTSDFIAIEKAGFQVAKALDLARLPMANTVACQVDFETIQPERVDDAVSQKYRELQFKLVIL